jgi:hypothetical protein
MTNPKYVICIENTDYEASLEVRKIYKVVPDAKAQELGHLRIIDESGEDYMYPAERFIDAHLSKSVEEAIANAA